MVWRAAKVRGGKVQTTAALVNRHGRRLSVTAFASAWRRAQERAGFDFELERSQRAPSDFRGVPDAVAIDGAGLHEVTNQAVVLVRGFRAIPMQRLAGVVLVVPDLAAARYLRDRVRKVSEDARKNRHGLACLRIGRQAHGST
jgi:hypothetical protein